MVRLLLQKGANINATGHSGTCALAAAAEDGHENIVTFLLSQGAQADAKDEHGMTPFMVAAASHQVGVARVLLQHTGGQGMGDSDEEGLTALHHAAEGGDEKMVRFLLLHGADPRVRSMEGTPREMAEECGHATCVAVFEVR
jgi:ankyrin repeat protein